MPVIKIDKFPNGILFKVLGNIYTIELIYKLKIMRYNMCPKKGNSFGFLDLLNEFDGAWKRARTEIQKLKIKRLLMDAATMKGFLFFQHFNQKSAKIKKQHKFQRN